VRSGEPISYATWVPGKPQFLTASYSAGTKSLCLWSCKGDLIREFDVGRSRIGGCAFIPGTQRFIAFGHDKIFVYDSNSWTLMEKGSFDPIVEPPGRFVSSIITRNKQQTTYGLFVTHGPHVLINLDTFEVAHMFDIDREGIFVIAGTFGGKDDEYFAVGSHGEFPCNDISCLMPSSVLEVYIDFDLLDGNIYIWDWNTKKLLCKQNVHDSHRTCNTIAWNPKRHDMIAAASDDGTVSV
jgi:WD40 repeat protein